jgi:WD40 repeat protein
VENVLAGFFYTQHNIRLNSAVFDRLNQMGKLLLIFDGFDEMADKVDHQKMIDNFWELAKVVTPNAKVILTCRTEHFPTAQVGRDTLRGELLASTARLTGVPPQFETLELMKFDDVQIREVLGRRTNEVTVEKVMGNGQVLDLLRRAVMAEFVLAALPEIEAGAEIDLARVYLYAVRRQMEENITTGRTFTSLADKLYFLCELSWEMLSTDRMSLNYREFPDLLRRFFGAEVESQKDLDHWHYDMMGQTMLVRNDDGDYSPAHRSLLEFFVAYKFAAELGLLAPDFLEMPQARSGIDAGLEPQPSTWSSYWHQGIDENGNRKLVPPLNKLTMETMEKLRGTFGRSPLNKAILDLLKPLLNIKIEYRKQNLLLSLIQRTNADESCYLGGNAATVLLKLDSNALEYQNLTNTNLACANLVDIGLKGTNLKGANLERCPTTKIFGSPNAFVLSQDNQRFITGHDDNSIRIWDRFTGIELQKLVGHKGSVNCLVLRGNGDILCSCSDDGIIRFWNLGDGTCSLELVGEMRIEVISLSLDGKTLYSGGDEAVVREWDLVSGICQRTFIGHKNSINAITISKNGQLLYSCSNDHTIKEWRIADGNCQKTFEGHSKRVKAILLSADDQLLYSCGRDGVIKEWKTSDGTCQQTLGDYGSPINTIALSNNGELLYSGSDNGTVKEWKLSTGNCQQILQQYKGSIHCLILSKDEQSLYSAGSDPGHNDGMIKEWKLSDGTFQHTIFQGYQDSLTAIAISNNGELLYSGSNYGIIKEWALTDSTCQRIFGGHQDAVNCLTLSKDGEYLYSGSDDCKIREWELSTGICHRIFDCYEGSVNIITIGKDGKSLYSGHENPDNGSKYIKEWNLIDGICLCTYEHYGSWGWGGNGDIFKHKESLHFVVSDQMVKAWEKIRGGNDWKRLKNQKSSVRSIGMDASRQFLYSSGDDGIVMKWDVKNNSFCSMFDTRLCAGANITGVKGLTHAQTDTLITLGAFDDNRK